MLFHKRNSLKVDAVDNIDFTPFLSLMVILVPVLLVQASFLKMSYVEIIDNQTEAVTSEIDNSNKVVNVDLLLGGDIKITFDNDLSTVTVLANSEVGKLQELLEERALNSEISYQINATIKDGYKYKHFISALDVLNSLEGIVSQVSLDYLE